MIPALSTAVTGDDMIPADGRGVRHGEARAAIAGLNHRAVVEQTELGQVAAGRELQAELERSGQDTTIGSLGVRPEPLPGSGQDGRISIFRRGTHDGVSDHADKIRNAINASGVRSDDAGSRSRRRPDEFFRREVEERRVGIGFHRPAEEIGPATFVVGGVIVACTRGNVVPLSAVESFP